MQALKCTTSPATECFPGQYCDAGDCKACPLGSFASVGAATGCTGVDADKYAIDCDGNAVFSLTSTIGGVAQVACPSNTFAAAGAAAAPGGYGTGGYITYYGDLSGIPCSNTKCAEASSITAVSAVTAAFGNTPNGFYATSGSLCTPCAAGSVNAGTASCTACTAGNYANDDKSVCTACGLGKYNALESQTSDVACLTCPRGSYNAATGVSACTNCPGGTYMRAIITGGPVALTKCEYCDAGTFSPNAGTLYGTTTATQGATACTKCPAGKWSDESTLDELFSVCTDCAIGTYSAKVGLAEEDLIGQPLSCPCCAAGKTTSSTGSTSISSCTACGANTYSLGPTAAFNANPQVSAGVCYACPAGSGSTTGATTATCTKCSAGQYSYFTAGTANSGSGTNSGCLSCPAGTVSTSFTTTATWIIGATSLTAVGSTAGLYVGCPIASVTTTAGIPAGTIVTAFTASTITISAATTAPTPENTVATITLKATITATWASGATSLTAVASTQGLYVGSPIASVATGIPAGATVTAFTATTITISAATTAAGTAAAITFSSACIPLSVGGTYATATGLSAPLICAAGQTSVTPFTACTGCAAGTSGSTYPAGVQTASTTGVCTACPVGFYTASTGSVSCTPCSSGFTTGAVTRVDAVNAGAAGVQGSSVGLTSCTVSCPAGTSATPYTGSGSTAVAVTAKGGFCYACPLGWYSAAGATVCLQCAAGSSAATVYGSQGVATASVQGTCTTCPVGYSSPAGSAACTQCLVGTFAASTGASQCSACSAGFTTSALTIAEVNKATGAKTTGSPGATVCATACPAGSSATSYSLNSDGKTYTTAITVGHCYPCPAGYTSAPGSTACTACAAGSSVS